VVVGEDAYNGKKEELGLMPCRRAWCFHQAQYRRELKLKNPLRCVLGDNNKHGGK